MRAPRNLAPGLGSRVLIPAAPTPGDCRDLLPRPSDPRPTSPPRDLSLAAVLKGFHQEVGFRIDPEHSGPGFCTVTGVVEARHLNINGVVHGGVYATILDTAMGGAVITQLAEPETTATTSLY
ncbi:phenylacetic acid degradation-related protein, partial [mine drainage metagenome]